jgi:hypothetical protein
MTSSRVPCVTAHRGAEVLHYCYPEAGRPGTHPTPPETNQMYIDPTTGSLVLQVLAAGVLSLLAMVSRVREAVKSFFKLLVPRNRR